MSLLAPRGAGKERADPLEEDRFLQNEGEDEEKGGGETDYSYAEKVSERGRGRFPAKLFLIGGNEKN